MKNLALVVIFLSGLTSCVSLRKDDLEEKEKYITDRKKNMFLIDLCSYENLPKLPLRPKLLPQELKNLSNEQMDKRIKQHIDDLDNQLDRLEDIVIDTRKRVEMCR